ncbi:MAG TPA: pyridoxal 5'-phosphate synthase glutaminase subunit PdxT [Thermoplasmatales archaeon]|nr:pyridoxal 5'-phosphate synthase glutaminase subunit PdxT [Thermoplasmatales archaeon]
MVNRLRIGVVGFQGAVSEHIYSMRKTLKDEKIPGEVFAVKQIRDLENINALILPGGESTTISKFLHRSELYKEISSIVKKEKIPMMGTCAGCVLLAKEISDPAEEVKTLKFMDMKVKRNAFGRQRESFEKDIYITDFTKPFHAVFIRAPVIEKTWDGCKPIAKLDNKIVMAQQGNILALSFHPELTEDLRIHKYFLKLIK